ncbi:MAG: hypothetical protein GW858_07035 [Sphingomonadales bacterium]|nr:hypothetical protein [Sphingomonadales bacterium]NCQ21657.1 hypothetical protein [Sphingomonadales bacterium]NCT04628.1 hypothetical protein [Sphingomonadales bacterium]
MANSRPPRLSPSGLQDAPVRRPSGTGRWVMIAGVVTAGLLALAWFDGGEESLHPIAEAVPLPEQEQ